MENRRQRPHKNPSPSGRQKSGTRPDDRKQSRLFLETAREVGADTFRSDDTDAIMGRLAKQTPEPRKPSRK